MILAFGKTPKELGVPGEAKFKNKGVSYCTICDAPFFKGQDVALVSWGDLAREPVTILSSVANKFYWIYPGEKPIHDDEFIEQAKRLGKAVFVPNSEVVEIKGDTKVKSVVVKNRKTGELQELPVSAVFVEVGYVTKSDFVKHLVELNERGEIIADWEGKTKTPGVFAAGDIVAYPYKQAVISAAMGVAAALSATAYVMKLKGKPVHSLVDWRAEKNKVLDAYPYTAIALNYYPTCATPLPTSLTKPQTKPPALRPSNPPGRPPQVRSQKWLMYFSPPLRQMRPLERSYPCHPPVPQGRPRWTKRCASLCYPSVGISIARLRNRLLDIYTAQSL